MTGPLTYFYPRAVRAAAALAAAGALGLWARPADAFCRSTTCQGACPVQNGCKTTGVPLFWPGRCVGVSLQAAGSVNLEFSAIEAAAEGALAAWSGVFCQGEGEASLLTTRMPDARCELTEFDFSGPNANAIIFRDTFWDHEGVENVLAFTTVSFSRTTGEIRSADIDVNTAFNNFTTATAPGAVDKDLQSILLHEMGHFLGLAHSDDPGSVMDAQYPPGTLLRELTPDDTAALCAAYPASRQVACDASPWGGFSPDCSVNLARQRDQLEPPKASACSASAPGAPLSTPSALGLSASLALVALRRRRGPLWRTS